MILSFLAYPCVFSQDSNPVSDEVEKVKAEWDAQYENWAQQRRQDYSPQWEGKLEDFNAEATALVIEHDRLLREQQVLTQEWKGVQAAVRQENDANQAIQSQIDAKKSLMDDKKFRERTAAKIKEAQKALDEKKAQLQALDRQVASADQNIRLVQLKLVSIGADVTSMQKKISEQETIERLSQQLQQAQEREKTLSAQLEDIRRSGQPMDPAVRALKDEIDALNAKITETQLNALRPAPKITIDLKALNQRKQDLLQEIDRLSADLEKIEKAQNMGIADQRIKALVDEMSDVDLRNNQLREQIQTLNENITILQGHIKKLEYQADALKALKGNIDLIEPFK